MARREASSEQGNSINRRKRWFWIGGGLAVLLALIAIRTISGPQDATAQSPGKPAPRAGSANAPANEPKAPELVALVNGEEMTRQELARECVRVFGKEVLESMVNKKLITEFCQRNNVAITDKDVNDEIARMAKKFNLPVDQWINLLKQERNITPQQYARDVVWPMLALKRLAAAKLTVSPQEIQQAYESEYGSAVQCRMIVTDDPKGIKEAYAKAMANPDDFPNLAKNYSTDVNVASAKGIVPPIRRHVGDPKLEQAAFSLKEGGISPIVQVDKQFLILKCETIIPAIKPPDAAVANQKLEDMLKERKLQKAGTEVFQDLQSKAKVENVMNDPAKSQVLPGVAALVNDQRITIREVSEECIDRHGIDVLEGMISRRLLEQALKKRNLQITRQHLDKEMAETAVAMGKINKDGSADVEGWVKAATEEGRIPYETLVHDLIWPSAALKLIVGESVKLTKEDIQKGYEANYGPRVRCRVIVLNNQRKAQEVWGLAREKRTLENFGQLAEQYSIEPSSKALQGKVPPIQMHGGQPSLEKEAFALEPGELSGIIQLNDKFVIMFCEGRTEPTKVKFEEVRDLIYDDLFDKKLRLAMNEAYESLKSQAEIVNQLTGAVQHPKRDSQVKPASGQTPATGAVSPTSANMQIGPRTR